MFSIQEQSTFIILSVIYHILGILTLSRILKQLEDRKIPESCKAIFSFFKIKTVSDYVLDVVLDYQIHVTTLKRV